MQKLTVALDWTPNTNHTGLYVAKAMKWYEEAGLDVVITPPSEVYSTDETPARSVVEGRADFCIAPSESVISCWTTDPDRPKPVAVATLLQEHASAIAVLKSKNMTSLKDLSGKSYASYEGRFEMNIIREIVNRAGGQGDTIVEVHPPKLDCFQAVLRGEADATWIFLAWEGVQAEQEGVELTTFPLTEDANYGFSYGYSPVLLAHPSYITGDEGKQDVLRRFLAATAKGYTFAAREPIATIDHLLAGSENHSSLVALTKEYLVKSQQILSPLYIKDAASWGVMKPERWQSFVSWLLDNHLITDRSGKPVTREELNYENLFTNDFLPTIGK